MCVILVGNKADMEERRQVSKKMGEELGLKYRMKFFEVSAKENRNVRELFEALTREVLVKHPNKATSMPVGTILSDSNDVKKKKKGNDCCK